MAEVLYVWRKGGDGWVEHSSHDDREAAHAAGVAALEAEQDILKFKRVGDAFTRGPGGTVIEVMTD